MELKLNLNLKTIIMKKTMFILLVILIAAILYALPAHSQTRCKAFKKDGKQCKMITTNANGYCQFHQALKYQQPEQKDTVKQMGSYTVKINSHFGIKGDVDIESFDLYDGSRFVCRFTDPKLYELITKDNL